MLDCVVHGEQAGPGRDVAGGAEDRAARRATSQNHGPTASAKINLELVADDGASGGHFAISPNGVSARPVVFL